MEHLRSGERGVVKFRFMYNTEYIKPQSIILLREGRTKIYGVITKVSHGISKDPLV